MAERRFRQGGRWAAPLLLLLLTSFAQYHQLTRHLRFLPDEAFFMTFARGAAVNGDWLLPGPLDKPPLSIYFSALSMVAVAVTADEDGVLHLDAGVGEFAGRLPNVYLAILLTALLMRLAWRMHRDRWAAVIAGALAAASPYLLAYGASTLTDMSLLFWAAASLYLALAGRWGLSGLALGLAFWSKQQAALFVPLLVMILLARGGRRPDWLRLGLPPIIMSAALLIWDGARPEASIFAQAAVNNAPETWLAAPALWLRRFWDWLGRLLWLLGPPLVTGVLLLGAAFVSARRWGGWTSRNRAFTVERALLLYIIGYLGAHAVLPFHHYDRYLLLILPPLVMLVAGQLARLTCAGARATGLGPSDSELDLRRRNIQAGDSQSRPYTATYLLLIAVRCYSFSKLNWRSLGLAALLAAGGLWSWHTGWMVGGDRRAFDGIDALAVHLNSKPVATVIYDPWLGWELGYYLGQWHDKRTVHYPTPATLVAGALALDEIGDRYLVAPVDRPHEEWLAALDAAGFRVAVDYARDRFIVYRLGIPSK